MTRFRSVAMLAELIEHLEPEPYRFSGHYWLESTPTAQRALEFDCEFTHDTKAVVADWPQGSFEVRMPFVGSSLHGANVQLFVRGFGNMLASLQFSDGNVLIHGHNEISRVFAHVCFDERKVITVVGEFELKGERHLFSLNGSFNRGPASIANVRSITRRA